jgi:hypothetical protein
MVSQFNLVRKITGPGLGVNARQVTLSAPCTGGLLISPESSRPHRADTLTNLSLMLIGLGFFAATLFFITELITITLS